MRNNENMNEWIEKMEWNEKFWSKIWIHRWM